MNAVFPGFFCVNRTLAVLSKNRNLLVLVRAGHLHVKTGHLCL